MRWLSAPAAFAMVVVSGVLSVQDDAAAHGGPTDEETSSNYRTTVTLIEPDVEGVSARVIDAGSRLELTNRTDARVIVHGYQGEPYLRIGPDGVFENRRSAATYLNTTRDGAADIPDLVDPQAAPEWRQVSTGTTARWHDHRAHWMSPLPPPAVRADGTREFVIFDPWVVPLRVGEVTAELRGDLTWVPPPSSRRWWTVTTALFASALFVMVRVRSPWVRASALAIAAGADLVATIGFVSPSVESVFFRSSQVLYPALLALAAARVAMRALRKNPGPHLAAGLAAVLALGMSGASRLDAFSRSQIATALPGTLDRMLTATIMAIGAALLVDFVMGLLRRPIRAGSAETANPPELVR